MTTETQKPTHHISQMQTLAWYLFLRERELEDSTDTTYCIRRELGDHKIWGLTEEASRGMRSDAH